MEDIWGFSMTAFRGRLGSVCALFHSLITGTILVPTQPGFWASQAGPRMWRQQEGAIEKHLNDLELMAAHRDRLTGKRRREKLEEWQLNHQRPQQVKRNWNETFWRDLRWRCDFWPTRGKWLRLQYLKKNGRGLWVCDCVSFVCMWCFGFSFNNKQFCDSSDCVCLAY